MRRRFCAIHSETAEEFIELAQAAWDKDLLFYEGPSKQSHNTQINFEYDERATNSTEIEEEFPIETQNVKIMIVDTDESASQIFDFCGEKQHTKKDFDYISKCECNENKQVTYHFWINDPKNSKFTEIIDVYLQTCDVFIYIYNKQMEDHYTSFIEKIFRLNKKQFKVYKVENTFHRTSSFKSLNTASITDIVTVKSLQEAMQRTVNQYI